MLRKEVHCLHKVDRGLSGHDIGNVLLTKHGEIGRRSLLTHDADEVIATEITAGPPKFAKGIHRYRVRSGPTSNIDGLRSCGCVRGSDEWFVLREVLLHRYAAAEPCVAAELCCNSLVLSLPRYLLESLAVDLAVHRGKHVTDNVGSHRAHEVACACCGSRQRAGGTPSQVRKARTSCVSLLSPRREPVTSEAIVHA